MLDSIRCQFVDQQAEGLDGIRAQDDVSPLETYLAWLVIRFQFLSDDLAHIAALPAILRKQAVGAAKSANTPPDG